MTRPLHLPSAPGRDGWRKKNSVSIVLPGNGRLVSGWLSILTLINMKRIAFISEHASPLAAPGGVDNGGQNVFVAELAKELDEGGYNVNIYTRRENTEHPEALNWLPGERGIHGKPATAVIIEKEKILGHM